MGFAMANQMGKMMAAPQPPPLDETGVGYYVGKNGKKAGPFDSTAIAGYIKKGAITGETLLWKEGMIEWQKAATFGEFAQLLKGTPPPLPE